MKPPAAARRRPSTFSAGLRSLLRFFAQAWKEFTLDKGLIRASGLAYSTLLALVPLAVVIFSLVSAFGVLDDLIGELQRVLINILVPTRQEEALQYIRQFLERAQALGFVGFLFFTLTSILLMSTIDDNFNEIWGTRPQQGFLRRLTTYTSVLVFGTVLLGASFSFSIWLTAAFPAWRSSGLLFQLFAQALPLLAMFLVLLLMITLIPSGGVRLRSALVGAAVGAVLWEIARWGFSTWVNLTVRGSAVYGSLAVVPIFLIWLYIAWIVVIFALEVTYVHQRLRGSPAGEYLPVRSPADQVFLGFAVFLEIARRFHLGEGASSAGELSRRLRVSPPEIERVVEMLRERRLLILLEQPRRGFVPARSLSTIRLRELADALYGALSQGLAGSGGVQPPAARLANDFSRAAFGSLDDRTVEDALQPGGMQAPPRLPAGRRSSRRRASGGAAGG